MGKPNYAFEKRKRDLAKKKKKEEKRQRKFGTQSERPPEDSTQPPVERDGDVVEN
jgi:hypothetical protein